MPPLSIQSTRDGGTNVSSSLVEPYYTDDDLVVLHDIVVLAQQLLPNLPARERLPTNALFKAYYDILPRIGINADHDSRYARILFKIGNLRGYDGTLFEKFEEVLSQRGITLEFDGDDHDNLRSSQSPSPNNAENRGESDTTYQDENQPQLPRRNSESSIWDLGNEAQTTHSKRQRRNRSVSPLGPITAGQINGLRSFISQATRAVSPEPLPEPLPEPPGTTQKGREDRGAQNVRTWLEARDEPPRRRGRSVSTHGSIRINRHGEMHRRGRGSVVEPQFAGTEEYQDVHDDITINTVSDEDQLEPSEVIERRVPDSLLETRAAVISHHYLQKMIVKKVRIWRYLAMQRKERKEQVNLIALRHDSRVLLRQAIGCWIERFHERRDAQHAQRALQDQQAAQLAAQIAAKVAAENAEKAQLEAQLEAQRVAEKHVKRCELVGIMMANGRDKELQKKAFRHWAHSASEKVLVTSVAKRHITRSRVFNTWKSHTIANEMKVRQMQLKKFYGIWQQRTAINETNAEVAIEIRDENLVRNAFRKWFQEQKVVMFVKHTNQNLARRAIQLWALSARAVEDTRQVAEDERQLNLATDAWNVWRARAENRVIQAEEADTAYKVKLCRNVLRTWRRETKFVPAKQILDLDVNSRLLRNTFSTWLLHARQEKQATEVDRSRILREALTTWRHRVRCKRLRDISDDRAVAKTFKTWSLATKLAIALRRKKQETTYTTFEVWYDRFQTSRSRRWEREELARRHDNKITATLVLRQWYAGMNDTSAIETAAIDFQAPRILSRALVPWREKVAHTLQLQKNAKNAEFFILASKTLKRWKASTEAAKREKRKAAYSQVRRMTKINLAKDMLARWRSKTQQVMKLNDRAQQSANNKTVIIGMNLFDQWRGRTEEMVEMESLWKETVLKKFFNAWKDRSWAFQALNIEAMLDFQERRQGRSVRKWSLRTIQARALNNTATEVHEKNTRKSFRKMFNYWRQRTAQQRPIVNTGTPPGTDTAENWSDFGDDVDMDEITRRLHERDEPPPTTHPPPPPPIPPPLNPVTPKPGYMATPSRRSVRVIAAASRFNSTTPRAPLSTPLERQLRAGYSGGSLSTFRRGRSTLGMDVGFADIPEG